jgi:pyruvate/2-oxoglutarate dehydrogenase complex dihydrolipoamide acyltransferase (E2) component
MKRTSPPKSPPATRRPSTPGHPERRLHPPGSRLGRRTPKIRPRRKAARSKSAKFPWAASGRAIANGADYGFTKLIFDAETHRVIGGAIVGPSAGDMIGEVCLAIEMGCDAVDIGKTIHPHPTLGETSAWPPKSPTALARTFRRRARSKVLCVTLRFLAFGLGDG